MRALRSAASVAASLALLIGVPWLLSATIGNPLDRVPDLLAGDVNDHVVLAALAAALYVAWAQFAVAFAVELISAVRRTPMPRRIPGIFAGQQGLARVLVSGALLLLPVTASTVVPAAQAIALTPAHHPTAAAVTELLPGPSAASAHAADAAAPVVADPGGHRHQRRGPHLVGPGRHPPRRRRRVAGAVGSQPRPGAGRRDRADQRTGRAATRLDHPHPRHHRHREHRRAPGSRPRCHPRRRQQPRGGGHRTGGGHAVRDRRRPRRQGLDHGVAGQRRTGRTRRRPVHRPGLHRTRLDRHHPHPDRDG